MSDAAGVGERRGVCGQQVSVGKHYGGNACNVLVGDRLLQFWIGDQLLKIVARTGSAEIRKKMASGTALRRH